MATIDINGLKIEYELLGNAGDHAVALTPGGRFSMRSPGLHELGEKLVEGGKRVLLWDRPNCGGSDISFAGESESLLQAGVLIELIKKLELGPTAIGGGSAGSRCTLLAAAREPEVVSHLLQWWITGGTISLFMLGATYYGESAIAARMGGMAAVAGTQSWAEQIQSNPKNRDIILKQDSEQFIKTMEKWMSAFIPSEESPVPGMTTSDFQRLTMPTLIFRGGVSDIWHPAELSDWVHKLIPHSEIVEAPWPDETPMQRLAAAAETGTGHFVDWPNMAPKILEFTS